MRYQRLVREHLRVSDPLSPGLRALPDTQSHFASTPAAGRFYRNEPTCLPTLMQPLLSQAHQGVTERCDSYALSLADWSAVSCGKPKSKTDKKPRTHKYDVGYELQTRWWLSDRNGEPLAPIVQNWVTKDGVWSSYHDERIGLEAPVDELTRRMAWIEAQEFSKPVVHLIDREAASIAHQRQWDEAGHWLVRRDQAGSRVEFNKREVKLGEVADSLIYQATHEVLLQGKPAQQYVAEAEITVTRRAKPQK